MAANSNTLATAFRHHQAGEFRLAEALYRQILQTDPYQTDTLHLLGLLHHQTGQSETAINLVHQAIEQDRDNTLYLSSLALIYRETDQLEAAAGCYRHLLHLQPDKADSYFALGVLLAELGQPAEAVASFRQAADRQPGHAEALYNLGVLLARQQQYTEAGACYRQVLALRPDYAEAAYNLAVLLRRQNQVDEALLYYRQAVALQPDNIFWQLERDTIFPLVMPDSPSIATWRASLATALSRYAAGPIDLSRHLKALTSSNALPTLYLNYHGCNDRALKEQYARLFTVSEPLAAPSTPRVTGPPYRLGFVVTGQHEGIFLRVMGGLLDRLDPDRFTISLICPAPSLNRIRAGLSRPDLTFLTLTPDLPASIRRIKEQDLDLVYYWEVGSDSLNYFLPFFRLAPVQCTSWGSMGTTGLETMDYFISSRFLEPDDAQRHYSESLVLLDSLLTYYRRPALPTPLKPPAAFNLPDQAHLYICPQSLLKLHPDFDPLLAEILRQDSLGRLILFEGNQPAWVDRLRRRWQASMPDVVSRIQFLPRQTYPDYLNLLVLADVMLDPLHFSGGITTFDGLAVGLPIVTLPGELMRGRMTAGCYQKIEVLDLVVTSPEEYVAKAGQVATDSVYQDQLRRRILASQHQLFEDITAVRNLEQFFQSILADDAKTAKLERPQCLVYSS